MMRGIPHSIAGRDDAAHAGRRALRVAAALRPLRRARRT